jgi:hypothetical protein
MPPKCQLNIVDHYHAGKHVVFWGNGGLTNHWTRAAIACFSAFFIKIHRWRFRAAASTSPLGVDSMDMLRVLKLNQKWLDLGIVTPDKLNQLEREWIASQDKNAEHYRWRAFLDFIEANEFLEEGMLKAIYDLGRNDPDISMGSSIMAKILHRKDCPQDLLENAATAGEPFLRRIAEKQLAAKQQSA